MIQNIIFDLGNVLISWKPEEYLRLNGYDDNVRKLILEQIVRSPEWLLLDNGDIDLNEAARRIAERSSLKIPQILDVFNLRTKILFPLTQNTRLLPELKKAGFRLYYLSNFPGDIFDEIQNRYKFFRYFDGGIISARVRLSKPDPDIFRVLLKMYQLEPAESLFIDDIAVNSHAAESVGIKGIHLPDPEILHETLQERLGIKFLH